ncbi:hypothetical protein JW962_00120 [Candidatus Dojkabacteria bacterium]|nr:hypothetical protein [Candidatus Dojkabacteria bacterium]
MRKILAVTFVALSTIFSFSFPITPTYAHNKNLSERQQAYITAVETLRSQYSELDPIHIEENLDLSFWEYLTFREYEVSKTEISRKDIYYFHEEELLFAEMSKHENNKVLLEEKFYVDIFTYLKAVLPQEIWTEIGSLHFFSDGQYGIVATTMIIDENPTQIELSIDVLDFIYNVIQNSEDNYLSTLVHESAHVLSLSETQLLNLDTRPWNHHQIEQWEETERNNCSTKYLTLGCAAEDSYAYAFYSEFWANNYTDRPEILSTWDEYKEYLSIYPNDFVSSYATRELEEDFAESFMYYVLGTTPINNEVMCKKILFFNKFKELKKIRAEFREISQVSGEPEYIYNICGSSKQSKTDYSTTTMASYTDSTELSQNIGFNLFDLLTASTLVVTSILLWIVNLAWFRWVVKK